MDEELRKSLYEEMQRRKTCPKCGVYNFSHPTACSCEEPAKVIEFGSDIDAYGACQCDQDVHTGDVMLITMPEGNKVIAIADTWPIAITKGSRELHTFKPGYAHEQWAEECFRPARDGRRILQGWKMAREMAIKLGLELTDYAK